MNKQAVHDAIISGGIIPVVRASSPERAVAAAEAVCGGGIPVAEITLTVPGAVDVIAHLVRTMGSQILVGAGTVLDSEDARRCLDAGAEFLVSPGFNAATVSLAKEAGKLIMAGALTPTEVMAAWKAGADFIKIFPCGNVGGPAYIKALKGPFPHIPMIPTGGVNLETAGDFIRAGACALGIGGELVSSAAMASGDFAQITQTAKTYVDIVRAARSQHKTAAVL